MKNISKKKILVIVGIAILLFVGIFIVRKVTTVETKVMSLTEQIDNDDVTFGLYKNNLLKWKVLEKDNRNHRALLFCNKSIDYDIAINDIEDTKWSSSYLRDYLNGEFCYSVFFDAERSNIIESFVENKSNPIIGTDAGPNTIDKIFILDFEDVKKYLNINSLEEYNKKYGNGIHPVMWVKYGKKYDAIFEKSGYNLDKTSTSDEELAEKLSKVVEVEKPENLGEVILPDMSTIVLTRSRMVDITDSDIEEEIRKEASSDNVYNKVNREAQLNDKVNIDFKGYVDGVAFDGGESTDYELVLGSGDFIPGFEENIVGHTIGEKFSINVTFPDNYYASLAGKVATFDIVINSIEELSLPPIDTEFVKKHTKNNSKTIEEYKSEIKKKLEMVRDTSSNQNLMSQLLNKLLAESKFSPTEEALAWQFSIVINEINKNAKENGTDIAKVLTSDGGTLIDGFDKIKEGVHEVVKESMIVEELSKKYLIELTETEVKEWFNNIPGFFGYDDITYEDYVEYVGYDKMLNQVKQQKAFLEAIKECNVMDE